MYGADAICCACLLLLICPTGPIYCTFFVGHCSASHSLMATIAAKCICVHARPHLNLLFAYGQHAHLYQKMPLNFGREKSPFIASTHQQSTSLIAMSFQSLKCARRKPGCYTSCYPKYGTAICCSNEWYVSNFFLAV